MMKHLTMGREHHVAGLPERWLILLANWMSSRTADIGLLPVLSDPHRRAVQADGPMMAPVTAQARLKERAGESWMVLPGVATCRHA